MASKITNDPRIDPRLKAIFGAIPDQVQAGDVASREQLLAEEQTDNAKARIAMLEAMSKMCDNEEVAPSKGLKITTETFRSEPDGNTIKIQHIRPDTTERLPAPMVSSQVATQPSIGQPALRLSRQRFGALTRSGTSAKAQQR